MLTYFLFYVNKKPRTNGDHEIHASGCAHMPLEQDRQYLGSFASFDEAVREAKKYFPKSAACSDCSVKCQTR